MEYDLGPEEGHAGTHLQGNIDLWNILNVPLFAQLGQLSFSVENTWFIFMTEWSKHALSTCETLAFISIIIFGV